MHLMLYQGIWVLHNSKQYLSILLFFNRIKVHQLVEGLEVAKQQVLIYDVIFTLVLVPIEVNMYVKVFFLICIYYR